MKRIFALVLTFALLAVLLCGCASPREPSQPQSITLIIAQTLPGCAAFEHGGESGTCFYAYDTQGALYRVLWNDFTGLSEKTVIVAEYNGAVRKLEYDEPASGWSPRYEITAVRITKQRQPVSNMHVLSGADGIIPYRSLLWSKTVQSDGTFTETYASVPDTAQIIALFADEIPELVLDGSVSYPLPMNCEVEKVYLLTPNADTFSRSETTFDALSELADGYYYVAASVLIGGNCDPDSPQNYSRYEDIFRLIVGNCTPSDAMTEPVPTLQTIATDG